MFSNLKKRVSEIIKKSPLLLGFFATCYSYDSLLTIKGRKKNKIIFTGSLLRNTKIRVIGKNNSVQISPKNRLMNCNIVIIGNNCKINIESNCTLKNLEIWLEDEGSEVFIGNATSIEGGHIAATEGESIKIGSDCMFSHRIEIRNGDSHSIITKETNQRINRAKSVIIGQHVWLGADAKVLKGSKVNEGAVIATGAIVSGIVEANCIWAGNPAKKIKENIFWIRERIKDE